MPKSTIFACRIIRGIEDPAIREIIEMKKVALLLRAILPAAGLLSLTAACTAPAAAGPPEPRCAYARSFDLTEDGDVVTISPHDGRRDTLRLERPLDNLVCMSTSYIGFLSALGCDSVISAVSGIGYVSDPRLRLRHERTRAAGAAGAVPAGQQDMGPAGRPLYDVGYEAALDYERILALKPDLLLTYTVSSVEPPFLTKLRDIGVPVLLLDEQLEEHPLARAEYVRLFGALTGREALADSLFGAICRRYDSLRVRAAAVAGGGTPGEASAASGPESPGGPKKVLLNIPYGDQWFIPGADNYISTLVRDAGGTVLGAKEGTSASGVISLEEAYVLSRQADFWLHPGWCRTRGQIVAANPLFSRFGIRDIYNNTLRTTPEGGNDFWESGALRADLVLEDLTAIFQSRPGETPEGLRYYFKVD